MYFRGLVRPLSSHPIKPSLQVETIFRQNKLRGVVPITQSLHNNERHDIIIKSLKIAMKGENQL